MTNQKPSEMLRKAWALIDAPEKWTQGTSARMYGGLYCSIHDENAVCFCSTGAVNKLFFLDISSLNYLNEKRMQRKIFFYLKKSMLIDTQSSTAFDIVTFNDTHTWEEVKAAWMKAIALAEEDEAKNA